MTTTKSFLEFVKSFQNKRIRIGLVSGLNYETANLQVIDDNSCMFNDKFGHRVLLAINQINRLEELR